MAPLRMRQVTRQRVERKAVPINRPPRVLSREIPAGSTQHAALFAALRPSDVYGYCHSVRLLRKRPLSASERAYLRDNCESLTVHKHGQLVRDNNDKFRQLNIYPFTEQLQLICANRAACEFLASLDERVPNSSGKVPKHDPRPPIIIYLEIALDMILPDEDTLYVAFAALKRCLVQRWNRRNQTVEFDNGGMSTGRRWSGRYMTAYRSKPSPVTGEVNCLHMEYRICSARAVRAAGVRSVTDLLTFDYTSFWEKNLVLRDVDIQRLGRYHLNRSGKRRRQEPDISDRRIGQSLWRAYGYDKSGGLCAQALTQNYGTGPFLKPIPSRHLLPSSRQNALFF